MPELSERRNTLPLFRPTLADTMLQAERKIMAISPCPVCELQLAAPTPIPNTRTLALNCHRCGSYDLTLEALHMLRDEIGRQPLRRAITSHAIQQINSTGSAPHKVTQDWLQSVWTHGKLPSPQEQADIFIKYLGAANVPSGSWVRCNPQHLTGLLGTADDPTRSETSGFVFIVNALKNRALIEEESYPDPRSPRQQATA